MPGERHEADPQPTLPPELRHETMAEKLSEIGTTGATLDRSEDSAEEETAFEDVSSTANSDGLVAPTLEQRSVVASRERRNR